MTNELTFERVVQEFGFAEIGSFREGAFAIVPQWKRLPGVYIWTVTTGEERRPVRVGIACSSGGVGGRHNLYNRWLAGKFKPEDAREQKVAALMRQRLFGQIDMWGKEIADRGSALKMEAALQTLWGDRLDLDLTISGSWIKAEMNRWRAEGRPRPV